LPSRRRPRTSNAWATKPRRSPAWSSRSFAADRRARCRPPSCASAAGQASTLLRKALDAFARLDVDAAVSIIRDDDEIDREFDGFVRKLITYMMEDPRTISPSLDLLFLAKAIERIGDHAKNVAEFIIYIVKGTDVRHTAIEQIESAVK
jgi:phosphate transport system protein